MKPANRNRVQSLRLLLVVGSALCLASCGTGTVYVGVAAPGPWVGYPPGVYGGYPGYYGRPWYAPDEEEPQEEPRGQDRVVAPGPEERVPAPGFELEAQRQDG